MKKESRFYKLNYTTENETIYTNCDKKDVWIGEHKIKLECRIGVDVHGR